jgi:hypothetical protein
MNKQYVYHRFSSTPFSRQQNRTGCLRLHYACFIARTFNTVRMVPQIRLARCSNWQRISILEIHCLFLLHYYS